MSRPAPGSAPAETPKPKGYPAVKIVRVIISAVMVLLFAQVLFWPVTHPDALGFAPVEHFWKPFGVPMTYRMLWVWGVLGILVIFTLIKLALREAYYGIRRRLKRRR